MADLDWQGFGTAFAGRLSALGYSLRRAEQQWPLTDKAMLSRASRGQKLSAGNFLLLCEMAGLDPFGFLRREKHRRLTVKAIVDQHVTASASRETGRREEGS